MKNFSLIILSLLFVSCAKIQKYTPVGVREHDSSFKPKWIKNLDPIYQTGNLPIGLASPLVHEGIVYAGGAKSLNAFSVKTGRLLWQEPLAGAMHSAPVNHGDLLIYGDVSGRIYAKNLSSEKMIYALDVGSSIDSTPVVSNGRLLVHTRSHKLICLDALTGKILWSYKRSVPYFSTLQRTSRPIVIGNRVFLGFADGYLVSFSLEEGQVTWERKLAVSSKFVDVDMTPAYFNGKLVVGSVNGQVEIIEAQTGLLLKRLPFMSNRNAVVLNNELYIGTTDGTIVTLDDSFNIKKEVKLSNTAISSMIEWKKGLVVSTIGKTLYFLNSNLTVQSKYDLGNSYSAVFGDISEDSGTLSLMSSRNRLYLFQ